MGGIEVGQNIDKQENSNKTLGKVDPTLVKKAKQDAETAKKLSKRQDPENTKADDFLAKSLDGASDNNTTDEEITKKEDREYYMTIAADDISARADNFLDAMDVKDYNDKGSNEEQKLKDKAGTEEERSYMNAAAYDHGLEEKRKVKQTKTNGSLTNAVYEGDSIEISTTVYYEKGGNTVYESNKYGDETVTYEHDGYIESCSAPAGEDFECNDNEADMNYIHKQGV